MEPNNKDRLSSGTIRGVSVVWRIISKCCWTEEASHGKSLDLFVCLVIELEVRSDEAVSK